MSESIRNYLPSRGRCRGRRPRAGSQAHAASVTVNAGAACTAFTWDQATSTLTCLVSTALRHFRRNVRRCPAPTSR